MGQLEVTVSHLRVTVGHPRVTTGHLRATMGHLRLTIGYLKATVVHIRVTLGHLREGNNRQFFSELHPKVRQTCCRYDMKYIRYLVHLSRKCEVCGVDEKLCRVLGVGVSDLMMTGGWEIICRHQSRGVTRQ